MSTLLNPAGGQKKKKINAAHVRNQTALTEDEVYEFFRIFETDILRRRPGESKTGGRDPHRQRASDIQKK